MTVSAAGRPLTFRLGHPREPWLLTGPELQTWAECAAVCLDVVGHHQRVQMTLTGMGDVATVALEWDAATDVMQRSHADLQVAAERGALAVVASLVHDLTDDLFFAQSVKSTGIDYWLARRTDRLFQRTARLEVSGMLRDRDGYEVRRRLKARHERLDTLADERPARIAVVVFDEPRTVVEDHGD